MNHPPVATGDVEHRPLITLRFRRRTLWFALAVSILLIAILTSAFLWQLYEDARLNAAIDARGGYVYSNYYSGQVPTAWMPWAGGRASGTYTNVGLENCNVTDRWLATHDLSQLSGMLTIDLNENPISDEALTHLARYRRVTYLQLSGTPITDDGLPVLCDCEDLSGLSLDNTAITDAGLASLDAMPDLNMLDVHDTRVTDAGILHVLQAHTITSLSIDSSILTPEVARAIGNESVYQITLHGDAIPAAVPLLVNATGLQHLSLIGDSATDECVPDLAQLTGLKYLQVTNGHLTRDGYDRLREALPGCQMYVSLYADGEEDE